MVQDGGGVPQPYLFLLKNISENDEGEETSFSGSTSVLVVFNITAQQCYGGDKKEFVQKAVCLYNFAQFTKLPEINNPHRFDLIIYRVCRQLTVEDAITGLQVSSLQF